MKKHPISSALLTRVAAAAVAIPFTLPAPGGWCAISPDSPQVRDVAASAATYLGRQLGRTFVIDRVTGAESQVVDGIRYRLDLRLVQVQNDFLGPDQSCSVTVWSRPWLKSVQVTGFACSGVQTDAPTGMTMLPL